jgi:anti-sigma-K factor RskA
LNIQDYISSGVIESYLLGELSEEACANLKRMAKAHPEVQAEIEKVEATMIQLVAKTPPPNVKSAILSQLDLKAGQTIVQHPASKKNLPWLAAAGIFILGSSLIYNIYLIGQLKKVNTELANLKTENNSYFAQLTNLQENTTSLQSELALVKSPENKKIYLKAVDSTSISFANVYWNQKTSEVFIDANSLALPEASKQYQLWALVDGKPVDMGVFDLNDKVQKMKSIVTAQAFAITLEKKGGSPTPNLQALCVIGNV